MKIDFPEWFGAFKRFADPAAKTQQAIVARDTEYQSKATTTTTVLTPEAEEAVKVVRAELKRKTQAFHDARRPVITKHQMELLEAIETLIGPTCDALRALDSFESEANRFLRQTNGPLLRTLANPNLCFALDEFRQRAAAAREQARADAQPIRTAIRKVLARPVFTDLLGGNGGNSC